MRAILIAAALAASALPQAQPDCPQEPGCPATTLLQEVELDNSHEHASVTVHLVRRFFTQEGIDRFADLKIREDPRSWDLTRVKGTVTLPGGGSIPFDEAQGVSSKTIRRGGELQEISTITPPGLVPGATVDFTYHQSTRRRAALSRWDWLVQEEIPVVRAVCTIRQGRLKLIGRQAGEEQVSLQSSTPGKDVDRFVILGVPSLPREPLSAPPDALAARMIFYSVFDADWLGQLAGQLAGRAGMFTEKAGKTRLKALELTAGAADPLDKMRALYRFVQAHIASEEARAAAPSSQDAESVDEVLARGFGDAWERTLLFLAMAREAGFEHGLLAIASRDRGRLETGTPDAGQFNAYAAAVKTGERWTFYDPAEPYCPFAMVAPHKESTTPNAILVVPKKGEGYAQNARTAGYLQVVYDKAPYSIATIPPSAADRNVSSRQATLKLGTDDAVQADIVITGTGLIDLDMRLSYLELDELSRSAALHSELLAFNALARMETARFEDLESRDRPASVSYKATLPGIVAWYRDRLVINSSIFDVFRPHPFQAATRRTSVVLPHTEKSSTRVVIEVPPGYVARELPDRQLIEEGALKFATFYSKDMDRIVFTRTLVVNATEWDRDSYPRLRAFHEKVRQADQQPLILWAESGGR